MDEYLSEEEIFEITDIPEQRESMTLTLLSAGYTTKTIRLVDGSGMSAAGDFTLSFSCPGNPYATPPESMSITAEDSGTATVNVPNDCGRLVVSVRGSTDYQEVVSREVIGDDFTIELSAVAVSKGTLKVYVINGDDNPLDGKKVSLFKYNDLLDDPYAGPVDYSYTANGYAEFSWPAGNYVARVYDPEGEYGDGEYADESGNKVIRIEAEEEKRITIKLEEEVIGQIKIKAVDKENKEVIDGATIRLEYQESSEPVETLTTDADTAAGVVSFGIKRDTDYTAVVSAKGYSAKRAFNLKKSDTVYSIELNECTPSTCGLLIVKVVDQDGKAIEGASVALYDYHTKSLATLGLKATDIEGMARFRGLSSGSYYAYTFKGANNARNVCAEPKECYFDSVASDDNTEDLTIVMDIPDGTVRIKVYDEENQPVPNVRLMVFDARTNDVIMQTYADNNGSYSFDTRADKRVYVRSITDEEPEKANYTTVVKAVEPSGVTEFTIFTEPPLINREVEIESLGLYSDGRRALTVAGGREYTARFRLKVPERKNYTAAGIHIRTGDDVIMEKDKIEIKSVNIPKASVIKAAYYDEESGERLENYRVTEGNAKWFNANWARPVLSGIYEIEAVVFVKGNASIGERVPVHYRAFAKRAEGTERHPADAEVTNELYALTKTDWYEVGSMTLCEDGFCFAAAILDIEEDLTEAIDSSYLSRPFNRYRMSFTLVNDSERVHNLANLRINNPDRSLLITDYWITVAGGIEKRGTLDGYEMPRIDAGDFRKNDEIVGHTLEFIPQKAGDALLSFSLISDQAPVWGKAITITTSAPKELDVAVNPNVFNVGVENDINVLVLDKGTGLEVGGAIVKLLDRHDYVVMAQTTNKAGVVRLTIPASSPGTAYKITAEKADYDKKVLPIEVNREVLRFNPKSIGINHNAKTKAESDERVDVSNTAAFPVKIKEVKLKGNFRAMLDMDKTQGALKSAYENYTIDKGKKLEMHLATFLSEEGKRISRPVSFEGSLHVSVENYGNVWNYEVPVRISIGIGGEVDNPGCLVITRESWTGVSEGQPLVIEFELQNNCTINGEPVELRNLEGMLEWKSNQLGRYTIEIGETEIELRGNYYNVMFRRVPANGRYVATLKFSPFGGVHGKAEADVIIRATNLLETEEQLVEAKIATEIGIENIKSCISFDRHYVEFMRGEEGSFAVSVQNFCTLPYDIELDSKLKLSQDKLTISPGGSETVAIMPQDSYAGQYPVFVRARMQNEISFKLIETIRAIIREEDCVMLSRYEFDLYDSPKNEFDGVQTAELVNNCAEKKVKVEVNMKDWKKAAKDGLGWGLVGGLFSILKGDPVLPEGWGDTASKAYSAVKKSLGLEDKKKEAAARGLTTQLPNTWATVDLATGEVVASTPEGVPQPEKTLTPAEKEEAKEAIIEEAAKDGKTSELIEKGVITPEDKKKIMEKAAADGFGKITSPAGEPMKFDWEITIDEITKLTYNSDEPTTFTLERDGVDEKITKEDELIDFTKIVAAIIQQNEGGIKEIADRLTGAENAKEILKTAVREHGLGNIRDVDNYFYWTYLPGRQPTDIVGILIYSESRNEFWLELGGRISTLDSTWNEVLLAEIKSGEESRLEEKIGEL
jgi:hypothetical protein